MKTTMTRRSFAGLMVVAAGTALAGCASSGSESSAETEMASEAQSADLIVIGGGCGGLAGAAKAAQGGASVIVLEGSGALGGTTAICGGHYKFMDDDLLALLPERTAESDELLKPYLEMTDADVPEDYVECLEMLQQQISEYLESDETREFDSLEYWIILHYLGTTGDQLDPNHEVVAPAYDLIYPAYANQAAIKDWLVEGGFEYEAFGNNQDAGGPFSVNPTGPVAQGGAFISVLSTYAEDAGAQIVKKAKVNALVEDGGRIVGVMTEDGTTYMANQAVLLASGGFGSNAPKVSEEDVRWEFGPEGLGSCEPECNDGTALEAAVSIGAATSNMGFNQYQTFSANGLATIETTIPMCMMASKMAVNKEGVRFRDDSMRFGTQSSSISLGQTDNMYYMIGDASGLEAMGDLKDRYEKSGDLFVADTIEEAANAAGLDGTVVAAEVEKFNSYVEAGEDPDFGRHFSERDSKIEGAPYTIMAMREYVQHTMGGVMIDATGHVLDEGGNPIEGLFAAGEAVGNLDGAQRRHGDNFAHILYYGCLAGETVAAAVNA
ncbi:Fumarate reductase flavoprotein subunit precursor [Slackia heliotrinireducens]|uniref:Succinate dehydrogenase/fumarate reductase flavoprotein subunit n=1 Tax=Slackia heliotrinireducens (strain ATCC 29202 / DSM 20476 / NCTC 11029 / RHS 1) TaxID=471855 RepID=C7N1A5_SLAHD|nr:FAD-dependent oxidoreductase [Slackia heliotrinireducens]ACV23327.1 succinate dehydrogenase/fumarate reductase flavoprotein subunit [Slackia heliotrinireducens DSM 20476]VEH02543.1 Fumarate reductase flavoprotein subunit precursor [Slackia heliotrinireducens]